MANEVLPIGLRLFLGKTSSVAFALSAYVVIGKDHKDALNRLLGIHDPDVWMRQARRVFSGEPTPPEEVEAQIHAWNEPYHVDGHLAGLCWVFTKAVAALRHLMVLRFQEDVPGDIDEIISGLQGSPIANRAKTASDALEAGRFPPIGAQGSGKLNLRGVAVEKPKPHEILMAWARLEDILDILGERTNPQLIGGWPHPDDIDEEGRAKPF